MDVNLRRQHMGSAQSALYLQANQRSLAAMQGAAFQAMTGGLGMYRVQDGMASSVDANTIYETGIRQDLEAYLKDWKE